MALFDLYACTINGSNKWWAVREHAPGYLETRWGPINANNILKQSGSKNAPLTKAINEKIRKGYTLIGTVDVDTQTGEWSYNLHATVSAPEPAFPEVEVKAAPKAKAKPFKVSVDVDKARASGAIIMDF